MKVAKVVEVYGTGFAAVRERQKSQGLGICHEALDKQHTTSRIFHVHPCALALSGWIFRQASQSASASSSAKETCSKAQSLTVLCLITGVKLQGATSCYSSILLVFLISCGKCSNAAMLQSGNCIATYCNCIAVEAPNVAI